MYEQRLEHIKRRLARLRELDPYGSVLFGAEMHQYVLNPPANPILVEAFEAKFKISLPLDYREFLLLVGNGGAGPYAGLWELKVPRDEEYKNADVIYYDDGEPFYGRNKNYPLFNKVDKVRFSSDPKYQNINLSSDFEDLADRRQLREHALEIGTQGCNISNLLIVSPAFYGEIWTGSGEDWFAFGPQSPVFPDLTTTRAEPPLAQYCAIEGTESGVMYSFGDSDSSDFTAESSSTRVSIPVYGINPFTNYGPHHGSHMSFLDWYEHWLDTGLRWFEE